MYKWVRVACKIIYKIVYNFSIEGVENIPQDKPLIIASNHRSFADPVLITMPMVLPVAYMARDTLFHNKLAAWFITKLGAFPIKRDTASVELFRQTTELLTRRHLVIFPEGTRQYENKVGSGKSGVAMIAAKSGADVLPCGIVFEGRKLRFRTKLTLRFGKIIKADELGIEGTSSKELRRVKERIMNAVKELVEGEQPIKLKMPDENVQKEPVEIERKKDE
ncbi:MAG: 1-acyl-sn-glycerol-3-phosphate acyltransferase [Ruminococcus sp.]|jgi:cytidylate kinase|nr:1-acyl-sn-glycerol-3-phosphate acyltransferase [Ruminococcus sp.]